MGFSSFINVEFCKSVFLLCKGLEFFFFIVNDFNVGLENEPCEWIEND